MIRPRRKGRLTEGIGVPETGIEPECMTEIQKAALCSLPSTDIERGCNPVKGASPDCDIRNGDTQGMSKTFEQSKEEEKENGLCKLRTE